MQSNIDVSNTVFFMQTSVSREPVKGVMSLCFPKYEIMMEEEITGSNAEQFQFSTSEDSKS